MRPQGVQIMEQNGDFSYYGYFATYIIYLFIQSYHVFICKHSSQSLNFGFVTGGRSSVNHSFTKLWNSSLFFLQNLVAAIA